MCSERTASCSPPLVRRTVSKATSGKRWNHSGHESTKDFEKIGERTWNLERLWNNKAGLTRADDSLPKRLLEEGHKEGPAKGVTVNLDAMLPIYYGERGWDDEGIPSKEKLMELGLASL